MLTSGQIAVIIPLLIYVCASSAAVLIIKGFFNTASYGNLLEFIQLLINKTLITGVILYVVGFLAWLYTLSKVNLSVVYPIATTLTFLAISILAVLILKEKFTINLLIGIILCLAGIFMISRYSLFVD